MNKITGRSVVDLMTMEFPDQRNIWGPIVTDETVTIVCAKGGVGKSWFAFALAHAIAIGGIFLKWRCNKEPVCLVELEMSLRKKKERFIKMDRSAYTEVIGKDLRVINDDDFGGEILSIATPKHQLIYEEAMRGYNVLIFDNYQSCCPPDPGKDDPFQRWYRVRGWFKKLRDQGKAIVLIDHTNKNGTLEGTEQKRNFVNNLIMLLPRKGAENSNSFEIVFDKTRDFGGKDAESLLAEVIHQDDGRITWVWRDVYSERIAVVRELLNQKPPARVHEISTTLGVDYVETIRLIREAKDASREL